MHERKRLMFERSDAFVALPGGIGTLEELVEQLTWQQLGRHTKPVLLANIDGFWEPLLALLDAYARHRNSSGRRLTVDILKAERVEDILPRLARRRGAGPGRRPSELAPEVGAPAVVSHYASTCASSAGNVTASMRLPSGSIDERRVVAHPVMRTQAGRAFGAAAGTQRRRMECIDLARSISRAGRYGRRCPARPAPCRRAG